MAASMSGEMSAEPNLTPLLDVVFQLITFFMLVMNFSADTFDQRVRLPIAPSATAPEPGKGLAEDRLVLNINSEGDLFWNGEVLDPERAAKELRVQAQRISAAYEREKKKGGDEKAADEGLPTTIVLRADRDTDSGEVYRYIQICQGFNFRKFSLKAMNAEE